MILTQFVAFIKLNLDLLLDGWCMLHKKYKQCGKKNRWLGKDILGER